MSKKPLVILTGPTAVGKTGLSIKLAKRINAEIISADSMQVYKKMNIGTAKIKSDEMNGVTHHLIDVLNPNEPFNVTLFCDMANKAINDICEKGKIPLIVGGTGFYIQALLYGIDFSEGDENEEYREYLCNIAKIKGNEFLHNMLYEVDPDSAKVIHKNNVKRVIRALEFYKQTGKKISEHNIKESEKESIFNHCYFVINDNRDVIYEKINNRVDLMIKEGLLEEVRALKEMGYEHEQSMLGIGYKEMLDYLDGICSMEDAIENIKKETRHYAKKQITWFKRERDVCYLNKQDFKDFENEVEDYICDILVKKNIFSIH